MSFNLLKHMNLVGVILNSMMLSISIMSQNAGMITLNIGLVALCAYLTLQYAKLEGEEIDE